MVKGCAPFDSRITTYDCSFWKRGPKADELFLKEDWYRTHLRRGNTFVRLPDDKKTKTILVRKGNQKFFDLVYEQI